MRIDENAESASRTIQRRIGVTRRSIIIRKFLYLFTSVLSMLRAPRVRGMLILRQFRRPWKPGVYCRVIDLGDELGKVFQFRPQFGKTVGKEQIGKIVMEKEFVGRVSLN